MNSVAVKATKSKSSKKGTKTHPDSAMAIHGTADGETHFVGIGNLKVIICQEGEFWFAQGLEIDYAADGKSLAEVKINFQKGLKATIGNHLQVYGSITNVLKPAPAEIWQELAASGEQRRFFHAAVHETIDFDMPTLPYSGIEFFHRANDQVAA